MGAKSAKDILGFEFDWLASDSDGHVAFFSTAGGGYAPEEFLRDTEIHDIAIDAILAMPPKTKARMAPQVSPGLKNTWLLMADRGVFAFDSDPNGGPYRLVAAPEEPICIPDLPQIVVTVASQFVLRDLRFIDVYEISNELLDRHR